MFTPKPGQIVRVRTRTYLVEAVDSNGGEPNNAVVDLACLDDDAQGEKLSVIWGLELDVAVLDKEAWKSIGKKGFDDPRFFSAYMHSLRWNCVTATDPKLFQSPFRAGIQIDPYQLEPLRKSLLLPRVNMFIADDVGLGKTIEAGLIASELLLRRRVREIVVSCPPGMLLQWKDELETRFGLTFEILDRLYIDRVRQERGFGVNPWTTFPRFLISHKLLIDEAYTGPLRDWLDNIRPGSLFILDESHHAAPSSGVRYAIDSKFTRAVRDIASRFEHRLFLSATPHNGHSNSFSALLELLDSHRFTRGVKVLKSRLEEVMVRRLKDDIRQIAGGFPKRVVRQVDLSGLPLDAPELVLTNLLAKYRAVRQNRMSGASKRKQAEAALLISGLQQRLLSSVEAFARTLAAHRRTMEKIWDAETTTTVAAISRRHPKLVSEGFTSDDDQSTLPEADQQELIDEAIAAATMSTAGDAAQADIKQERELLTKLELISEQYRGLPDARIRYLISWINKTMCKGARLPGEECPAPNAPWSDLRLIIFTEYDDTKRYIVDMLRAAIADTDKAEFRIDVYHGPTPSDRREAIKRAFNLSPKEHPIRILVATDAAREGLNLQAHCYNLFHFDVPWNPSRLEQRNGRIDRKLQPKPKVHCRYFVHTQRPEDRVLKVLVRKTDTIRKELGSLAQVLEDRLTDTLSSKGIRYEDIEQLEKEIEAASLDHEKREVAEEELEATRERQEHLLKQIETLRNRIQDSRRWIGLNTDQLRDALSCSLELLGADSLKKTSAPAGEPDRFSLPDLGARYGADPTWASTLDTLRVPPKDGFRSYQWRKDAPVRPVVFEAPKGIDDDVVQLHLSHRVVQRLLGRFIAQGFIHHDLSRACLAQSTDAIPRVVLLGRLSLYGKAAVRLHEEIITVTARWIEPSIRKNPLSPYSREAEGKTLDLLEQSFHPDNTKRKIGQEIETRLHNSIERDIEELLPHLEKRGEENRQDAESRLTERGKIESEGMRKILEDQKRRVSTELGKAIPEQLALALNEEEKRTMDSNRKYWQRWLQNVEGDLQREPARIRDFYTIASYRIEPIGLAYLWPVTG